MDLRNNFSYGDLIYGLGGRDEPQEYLLKNGLKDLHYLPRLTDEYNHLIGLNRTFDGQTTNYHLYLQIYNFLGRGKNEFKLNNFNTSHVFDKCMHMEGPFKGYLARHPGEVNSYKKYATSWAQAIGKYPQKFNDGKCLLSMNLYYLIINFLCRKNISHFIKRGRKIHFILEDLELKLYITSFEEPLNTAFEGIDSSAESKDENECHIKEINKLIDKILIQLPSITLDELIECYQLYKLDYTYRNNIKFYNVQRNGAKQIERIVESSPPWVTNKDQWQTLLLKLHNSEFRNMSILMNATIVCFNNYIKKQIGSKEEDVYVREFVVNMLKVSLSSSKLKKAFKCIYQLICAYDRYIPEKYFFAEMLFEYLWRYKENFLYLFRGVVNFNIKSNAYDLYQNMSSIFTNIRKLTKKDFKFSIKERPKDDFYTGLLRSKRHLENDLIDNNYSNLEYYSDSNGFIYAKSN
ncbi:hypothetical protein EDC55_10325 [Allofrancisella inopinata]|uniref:Uncharacterized protein n=1 Tax=Allofrancisella inopinata TaxID=1085647 RepID=A0AAE6YJE3_9GAMM|nr:hypothetical protein [Allofrancisella inopinata]QIV96701.1 hypothetical protein E4K63_07610 [Allofrancisella inopinata]TDT73456.1 hypothetical protein EDC55_10325 [Allofrancisella inopinata]